MTLQTSGTITLQDIATEFGGTTPHSLSEYYGVDAGVPTSGTISFNDFYGTSSVSPSGEQEYTSPGTYSWVCPDGVSSVNVVCIGAGGGGVAYDSGTHAMHGGTGGGLGWKNSIAVTPGQSYTVVVGAGGAGVDYPSTGGTGGDSYFINTITVRGTGGSGGAYNTNKSVGGSYVGDGGGYGGGTQQTSSSNYGPPGGGGAGGYSGNGGKGTDDGQSASVRSGAGGAAAGGFNNGSNTGYGGGGVGIYGEGTSGAGDTGAGAGGSMGTSGTTGGVGGLYGAGGGGGTAGNGTSEDGAGGAVRIVWGDDRLFPNPDPLSVFTFYESRYGDDMGTVSIYIVDASDGSVISGPIYTASGDLGTTAWQQRSVGFVKPSVNYRIAFHYESGPDFHGDYAIDTVEFDGALIGDTFYNESWLASNSNTTSASTALSNTSTISTSITNGIWNANSGGTGSNTTGPTGAQGGTYYAYTEVTSNFNVNMWLFSPTQTP